MITHDSSNQSIFNNSEILAEPINLNKNDVIDNPNKDHMKEDTQTKWIEVTWNTRRYKATINCIHMLSTNLKAKIDNLLKVLETKKRFLECKPFLAKIKFGLMLLLKVIKLCKKLQHLSFWK